MAFSTYIKEGFELGSTARRASLRQAPTAGPGMCEQRIRFLSGFQFSKQTSNLTYSLEAASV